MTYGRGSRCPSAARTRSRSNGLAFTVVCWSGICGLGSIETRLARLLTHASARPPIRRTRVESGPPPRHLTNHRSALSDQQTIGYPREKTSITPVNLVATGRRKVLAFARVLKETCAPG